MEVLRMEAKKSSETKNPIQSAQRIFQVLETLSTTGPIGLMELSGLINLHKSTTHRLLMSLIYMEYVKQDESSGKYSLSFKVLEIAGRMLNQLDIFTIAHPYIQRLVEKSGETAHLVERDGIDVIYIDKVESPINSIRMGSRVGTSIPMYCSGVGKSILATLSKEEVTDIWNRSKVVKLTQYTIITLEGLFDVLKTVREKGYALDDEENEEGVRCIAACIQDYTGKAKNAFSISAPISRMSDSRIDELSSYVLEIKGQLSKELGYRE